MIFTLFTSDAAMKKNDGSLTDAQLKAELSRCEYCEEKPCKAACPADCSPTDFIMAARIGEKADYRRAGALIVGCNPLGWVCGVVCPDYFCMKACSRRTFDRPINIPAVQASVMKRAYAAGLGSFKSPEWNGKKVAVIGAGPAGLGAASVLAQRGYKVTVYEQRKRLGGMMNLIPDFRLNQKVPRTDIGFTRRLGGIDFQSGKLVANAEALLETHDAVIVSAVLNEPMRLNIPGEEYALSWQEYLENQKQITVADKKVAILGGGAVAADCATTATRKLESAGAMGVEYSLSCPQGGDGTAGDVVSQNAELTAKIIDWVMEASSEGNPKLFKLTAAVTAIQPIIRRIQEVFAKYPNKQGGVTLANSFPSLVLRKAEGRRWEEGVVIGMSGEGVLPISNLTLAKVSGYRSQGEWYYV
jgi:Dihydroprymidine dehydrogenase domain II, 4Fe-4S cluster/Pyridine nucleotide-disulphide oxidoreductase